MRDSECSVLQLHVPSQGPDQSWERRCELGWIFAESGWGKLHNLKNVVNFFRSLGIPHPELHAPFVATVEFVGYDCDLALLALEDESFFEGLEPLGFGELPKVRSTVITYVNPAVAVALGLLFLNERFTVGMGIGFPLILLGSVLAASTGRSRATRIDDGPGQRTANKAPVTR